LKSKGLHHTIFLLSFIPEYPEETWYLDNIMNEKFFSVYDFKKIEE